MFSIQTNSGKHIDAHSYFGNEDEILLPPGIFLKVIDTLNPAEGLHIIHVREILPPYKMLAEPFDLSQVKQALPKTKSSSYVSNLPPKEENYSTTSIRSKSPTEQENYSTKSIRSKSPTEQESYSTTSIRSKSPTEQENYSTTRIRSKSPTEQESYYATSVAPKSIVQPLWKEGKLTRAY
jgi:hypothetical protein